MKRILTTLQQKWAEYLLEMIVITFGILGAYALNNWNESVNNEKRAIKLIKSLKTEFLTNQIQLNYVIGQHLNVERSATLLLMAISENEILIEDSLKHHFTTISNAYTFDPQNSVLRSSVSSGDIHLIESDSLLTHLFGWTDLVLDAQEEEIRASAHYNNVVLPFSHEYIMETELISYYYATEELKSNYSSDYKGLVYNRRFENIIAVRLELTKEVLIELRPIQYKNEAILSQLDKVLNESSQ